MLISKTPYIITCMGLEDFLKGYAKLVDKVDRITGPLSASLYLTGTDWGMNYAAAINTLELTLFKAPFVAIYLHRTRDFKSLGLFLPKELVTNFLPVYGFADVIPLYSYRTRYFLNNTERCLGE
jgi:hypothetical protein